MPAPVSFAVLAARGATVPASGRPAGSSWIAAVIVSSSALSGAGGPMAAWCTSIGPGVIASGTNCASTCVEGPDTETPHGQRRPQGDVSSSESISVGRCPRLGRVGRGPDDDVGGCADRRAPGPGHLAMSDADEDWVHVIPSLQVQTERGVRVVADRDQPAPSGPRSIASEPRRTRGPRGSSFQEDPSVEVQTAAPEPVAADRDEARTARRHRVQERSRERRVGVTSSTPWCARSISEAGRVSIGEVHRDIRGRAHRQARKAPAQRTRRTEGSRSLPSTRRRLPSSRWPVAGHPASLADPPAADDPAGATGSDDNLTHGVIRLLHRKWRRLVPRPPVRGCPDSLRRSTRRSRTTHRPPSSPTVPTRRRS